MSSTTETTQQLTFRRYKDGDNKIGRLSEKIMQASFTHKCPTYIQSTPPARAAARRARISAAIWPSCAAPRSRRSGLTASRPCRGRNTRGAV